MTKDEYYHILSPYKYTSFDLFDTLMFRMVPHPAMIFDTAERWYHAKYHQHIHQFRLKREYAENEARHLSNKEITLKDIYKRLPLSSVDKERMMSLECDCEVANCIPNTIMVDIANHCFQEGKTIIITTDMYLPRETIVRILNKIGVPFHFLFTSGEEGVTKRSGKLFPVILDKLQIRADELIHMGDDDNNDIIQPHNIGIRTTKRLVSLTPNHPALSIGYNILGPFMASFSLWLHRVKEEEKLDKLYFIAREGYFMKVAYEALFPEEKHLCRYIHLNKNLLRLPSLFDEQPSNSFIQMLPPRNDYSWMELFVFFHIEDLEELCTHIKKFDKAFDENNRLSKADLSKAYHQNILKIVLKFLNPRIEEQYNLFMQYINDNQFLNSRIGLVNNSLKGNGQKVLERILSKKNIPHHIIGLQLSATQECKSELGKNMRNFFSENSSHPYASYTFIDHALIVEHLLFENAGTALYFKKDENNNPVVICDDIGIEEKNIPLKNEIQEYALQYLRNIPINIQHNLSSEAISDLCSFLSRPSKAEATYIRQFYDVDIDGCNHLINDKPFSKRYIYLKDKPPYARWIEGYLALNNVSPFEMYIFKLRRILLNTLSNKSGILTFLKYILSESIHKLTHVSGYLLYKSYRIIKLRVVMFNKRV